MKRKKVESKVDDVKDTLHDAEQAVENMEGSKEVKEEQTSSSRRVVSPGTSVAVLDLKGGVIGTGAGSMTMAYVGGGDDGAATGAYDRSVGPAPARRVGIGAVDRLVERDEHEINFKAASASRVLLDHEPELFADKDQSVQAAIDAQPIWAQTDIGNSIKHPNYRTEMGFVSTEKMIYVNGQHVGHVSEPNGGVMYPRESFSGTGWAASGTDGETLNGGRSNYLLRGMTVHFEEGVIVGFDFDTTELPATGELAVIDQLPDHRRVAYNEALQATTIKMRDLVEDPANIDKNLYSPLATGFPNTYRVQRLKQDIEMGDGALAMLGLRSYGGALATFKRLRKVFGSDTRAQGGYATYGVGNHDVSPNNASGITTSADLATAFDALLGNTLTAAMRQSDLNAMEYVYSQDSRTKYSSLGSMLVQPRGMLMRLKHGLTAMDKLTFRCDKQFVKMVQETMALHGDGKSIPMMGVTKIMPILPYNPNDWFYYDANQGKLRGKVALGDNVLHGTYGTLQEVVSPLLQAIVDVFVNELGFGLLRSRLFSATDATVDLFIPFDFDITHFSFAQQLIAHALQWYPMRRDAAMAMWDAFESQYGVNPLDMSDQIAQISSADIFKGGNFENIASPFKEVPLTDTMLIYMMDPEDAKYFCIDAGATGTKTIGVQNHWSRGLAPLDPMAQYAGAVRPYDFLDTQMNWPMLRRNLVAPILDRLFAMAPSEYRSTYDRPVSLPWHATVPTGGALEYRELRPHTPTIDVTYPYPTYLAHPTIAAVTGGTTETWGIQVTVADILCVPRTNGRIAPIPNVAIDDAFGPETVISYFTRTPLATDYVDRPIERYNIFLATTSPRTASPTGAATAKNVYIVSSVAATLTPTDPTMGDLEATIDATGYHFARTRFGTGRDRITILDGEVSIGGLVGNDTARLYTADSLDYYFGLLNDIPWLVNPFNRGSDDLDDDTVMAGPAARIQTDDEFYYFMGLAGYTRSDWSRGAERRYGEKMQVYNEIVDKRFEITENKWYQ